MQAKRSLVPRLFSGLVSKVPFVGWAVAPLVEHLADMSAREIARQQSVALRVAERESGMSREDLADTIKKSPELVTLVNRVLFAAGKNTQDELLEVQGAALGRAARNSEDFNEAEAILVALEGVTGTHIRILQLLTHPSPICNPDCDPPSEHWCDHTIQGALGLSEGAIVMHLNALVARGFIKEDLAHHVEAGNGRYEISDYGQLVLDVLQRRRAGLDL